MEPSAVPSAREQAGRGVCVFRAIRTSLLVGLLLLALGTGESQAGPREDFVTRFYGDVLGRAPEPTGLAGWADFLRGNCNAQGFDAIARGFFDSLEFRTVRPQSLTGLVTLLYQTFLGRDPEPQGLAGWADLFRQGRLTIALQGFIPSQEFQSLLPNRTDRAAVTAVVTRLYQQVLGRDPEPAGLQAWVDFIVATGNLEAAATGFLASQELESRPQTFRDYVTTLYRTFLNRDPEPAGLDGWEGILRNTLLQIINAGFVPSAEFQGLLPQVCTGILGTAATGSPIAGAVVTIKDRNGTPRTTTTDANGNYNVDVAGLTAPFLLKVDLPSGGALFSIGSQTGVVNIHPFTDLIISTFYKVQGLALANVFNTLSGSTPVPTDLVVKTIAAVVKDIVHKWLTDQGLDPTRFDLITSPFSANGTGFDGVLKSTTVSADGSTVTLSDPATSTTQTTTLGLDTTTSSVTVSTTTTAGAATSSSVTSAVVSTTSAQQTALDGVTATLAQVKTTVNSRGAALADTDLLGFFDVNYLNDGFGRDNGAAEFATDLRGVTINSFTIDRVLSFDATAKVIGVLGTLSRTEAGVTLTEVVDEHGSGLSFKQQLDGSWHLFGNQQIARATALARPVNNMSGELCCDGVFKVLFIQVGGPEGGVTSATLTGGGFTNAPLTKNSLIFVDTLEPTPGAFLPVRTEHFDLTHDAPGGKAVTEFPPAGTLFTFTVTPATGSPQTLTDRTQATTTESISVTNLTGHALADAKLGQPLTVNWTLPKSFPIANVDLLGNVSAAGLLCHVETDRLPPTATSGTITFPTTCGGNPVVPLPTGPNPASISVVVTGVNGEETTVQYQFR